jgi:phosphopantothenoylcysteine synthetase/decarboxylase
MKILVTAGATREPIDAVRFLSNVSTGSTGAGLANEFLRLGHAVVLLHGENATRAEAAIEHETFSSAADLRERLQRRLTDDSFDVVVMAAAVADYRPTQATVGKLASAPAERTLQLIRNEKILPQLKSFSSRPLRVIGFKLTVEADAAARRQAVAEQFNTGGVDAVVHNDLAEIRAETVHPFWLWSSAVATPVKIEGVPALAASLAEYFATVAR